MSLNRRTRFWQASGRLRCSLTWPPRPPRSRDANVGLLAIYPHRHEARHAAQEESLIPNGGHLEQQATARAREAKQLPEGEAKLNALRNEAQLRAYVIKKRAFTLQAAKLK